jgi:hypothetical protein
MTRVIHGTRIRANKLACCLAGASLLAAALAGCGDGGTTDNSSTDGPCDLSDYPGFDSINGGEADFVRGLLAENECAPGWPPYPRRYGSITEERSATTTLSVGLSGSFFDIVQGEASGSVIFGMGASSNLLLVKSSDGGTGSLTREGPDGVVYLDYEDRVPFVGQCTYKTNADVGNRYLGKAKVLGSGVETQADFKLSTEAYQGTNFFHVSEGDTVSELLHECDLAFNAAIRNDVAADLKNILASTITIDAETVDETYLALDAALHGPDRDALTLLGHAWNVKAASWELLDRDQRRFRIRGQLSHRVSILPDDQVYYDFEFHDGEVVKDSVSVEDDGGGWQSAAREIARLIADEAYREFRGDLSSIEPGVPLVARLFPDSQFGGDPIELGVGAYTAAELSARGLGNDALSSLQVPAGLIARLYVDAAFQGSPSEYRADVPALPDRENDQVSAVIIARDPAHVRSYQIVNVDTGALLPLKRKAAKVGSGWALEHVRNGYYLLSDSNNQQVLEVKRGSHEPGAALQLADRHGEDHALWNVVRSGGADESYLLINRESGLAITVDGETLSQQAAADQPAQRWHFE